MTPKSGALPDAEELKRSLLEILEEKRKIIVGLGILLVIAIVGIVFYSSLGRQAENEDWYELYTSRGPGFASTAKLEELTERGSRDLRTHALLQLAEASIMNQDYDGAIVALTRLQDEYGDSVLARLASPNRLKPLPALLLDRVKGDAEWRKKYGYDEDPEVGTDRVALVETDKGGFWIGFFADYSPKHVENFIAKAKEGAFNGTLFYHVSPTQTRFGGATTLDDDETNDTSEVEGATYLDPEKGRFRIEHLRGMVSSVLTDEGESAEKVSIAFSRARDLSKRQTIFGQVLKARGAGMAALDQIRNVKTYATSGDPLHREERYLDLPDHPVEPMKVIRISIWSKDEIEEGHAWDTAAVDPKAADPRPAEEPEKTGETDEPAEEDPGGEKPTEETPEDRPAEEKPGEK